MPSRQQHEGLGTSAPANTPAQMLLPRRCRVNAGMRRWVDGSMLRRQFAGNLLTVPVCSQQLLHAQKLRGIPERNRSAWTADVHRLQQKINVHAKQER